MKRFTFHSASFTVLTLSLFRKAPIAVLKTVPPHLRVFPFPDRGQEKLMMTAVAKEEMGEDVELDMNLLSGTELCSFLEEVQFGASENSIPIHFAVLNELSSNDAIVSIFITVVLCSYFLCIEKQ